MLKCIAGDSQGANAVTIGCNQGSSSIKADVWEPSHKRTVLEPALHTRHHVQLRLEPFLLLFIAAEADVISLMQVITTCNA